MSVFRAVAFPRQKVDARATLTMVQIFAAGELIAPTPARTAGKQSDMAAHYPPENGVRDADADLLPHPGRVGRPARHRRDHRSAGRQRAVRLRAAQGVQRLVDKYGPDRLDAACGKAISVANPPTAPSKASSSPGSRPTRHHRSSGNGGSASPGPQLSLGRRRVVASRNLDRFQVGVAAWTGRSGALPPRDRALRIRNDRECRRPDRSDPQTLSVESPLPPERVPMRG